MERPLEAAEVRVLGALIEKDLTTPEYYPLTLNALVNACNQKNNRDPVVNYDDATVEAALEGLRRRKLASEITGAGLRVPKYRHLIGEALNLGRRELALLCVLLLRGPQTLGELRDRTERMHPFADLEEVEGVLTRMAEQQAQAVVARFPRQPGAKEPRYGHLLAGQPLPDGARGGGQSGGAGPGDRMAALEEEVGRLRLELEELRRDFTDFRRRLE